MDREAASRYGLTVAAVNDVVMTAIGGMRIDETVEGRERYPVSVRYARSFREDPEALRRVLVPTPTGAQVPLGQVADFSFETGPPLVRSEDGSLLGYVFVDTGERAIADYVEEARRVVTEEVDLPPGVRLEWAGQFTYFERAREKLAVVLPVTLFIIVVLLLGLMPLMWSTGTGADVMKRIAAPMVGGIVTSFLLQLTVYPAVFAVWKGRGLREGERRSTD